ncbi:hypothetical protein LOTGIDRAFT_176073 [Lottia gigantea]|uniref:Uncharacterized protein n=1 Tax=Lottia gigantea TaxID=225164 RepID=V3Z3E3_LOTGI|nr:hypothetical protein LOTGIDRAFT_176073 [Lottia gigantea]ESO85143.1 hypothetical protein LOTGIDRAFT_176073 [Lottia gigantea]
MNYRASPIDGVGLSPSQILMNRQLRTKLLITSDLLNSKVTESRKPDLIARQQKQKFYYDRQSVPLPSVKPGEIIRVQKKQWEPAIVDQKLPERSYIVRIGNNKLYRGNRRQLLKTGETSLPSTARDDADIILDNPPQPPYNDIIPTSPKAQEGTLNSLLRENRPQRTSKRPKHLEDYVCT